jgi:Na+/melibiose symporter-like transporter
MRNLLRDRNARLLLTGQAFSLFGDRAMYLVLGIWVKTLTGSNAQAGLVFFVLALPGLIGPALGLVVDRSRKRPLMIATDLSIGTILLSLLFVHGRSDVWIIYAVTLLYGTSGYLFSSARSALLTVLLPAERLADANAALQSFSEGSRLIAPLIGAGIFAAVGGAAVAVLDAATFGCSAVCLALLELDERRPVPSEHHLLAQVTAGMRHVGRSPGLRRIVGALAIALLVVGFAETVIFAVLQYGLHRSPAFLGVLSVAQGVGALAGAATAAAALRRFGDGRTLGLGILLFAAGDSLFLIPLLGPVILGFLIAGIGVSWAVVSFGTAVQLRTPADLQGRVYSAADTLVGMPQTLSIALGAGLVAVVDYRVLIVAMALVTGACGIYMAIAGAPDDVRRPSGGCPRSRAPPSGVDSVPCGPVRAAAASTPTSTRWQPWASTGRRSRSPASWPISGPRLTSPSTASRSPSTWRRPSGRPGTPMRREPCWRRRSRSPRRVAPMPSPTRRGPPWPGSGLSRRSRSAPPAAYMERVYARNASVASAMQAAVSSASSPMRGATTDQFMCPDVAVRAATDAQSTGL